MPFLNPSTARRLRSLRQTTEVWEGARCPLPVALSQQVKPENRTESDWIIWCDSENAVRALDIVPAITGPEGLVRVLLTAMESPQPPAQPARPKKILVCDREMQFFLRGALQELEIQVEYAKALPLVDRITQGIQDMMAPPTQMPSSSPYLSQLNAAVEELWANAPWRRLADHQIIEITLNYSSVKSLYVSFLGLLGMEYGVLMYRTQASLEQFRQRVTAPNVQPEDMQAIFLEQDCLFVNFEPASEPPPLRIATRPSNVAADGMEPMFGSIHPLEGMRGFLDEEESLIFLLALEALHRFWQRHGHKFDEMTLPAVSGRYRIAVPSVDEQAAPQSLSVTVKTLPNLSDRLLDINGSRYLDINDDSFDLPDLAEMEAELKKSVLNQDFIPEKSCYSIGMIPWGVVETFRLSPCYYPNGQAKTAGDGLPVFIIQTTKPKAKDLVAFLEAAGGVRGLGFATGENPFNDEEYDLGIIQTQDQNLHLFGEYSNDEPIHQRAKQKWNKRCKGTKGWCGLVIASGVTGRARGNPSHKNIVALFEVQVLKPKDFGVGTFQMMPQIF